MPENSSKSSSKGASSSSATSKSTSSSSSGQPSRHAVVTEGWGSRNNFQNSYGLDKGPSGYEEGNNILDAMQDADRKQQRG
ncbi:MAG: hypothetical protein M4579_002339 [Chaenotheca gracillima]|nr:MAG: hypothetical protein M4579_002339 [Chaenotheca gracillima]